MTTQKLTKAQMLPYLEELRKLMTDNYKTFSYASLDFSIEFEFLRKYIRIVNTSCGSRSCSGFIMFSDDNPQFPFGSLLKSDGWKKPALNFTRGSIFNMPKQIPWTGIQ